MNISNKRLGITTDEVNACEDIDTLLLWSSEVEADIAGIRSALDHAKGHYIATGEYADPQWFAKASSAARLQGVLKNTIQGRISVLKRQERLRSTRVVAEYFVDIARHRLDKDLFWEMLNDAKKMRDDEA